MTACLKQGSAEWLARRKECVTATDAAIILGIYPWKTPYYLYLQKLDLAPPDEENINMREGKIKEEPARQCLEKKTELFFSPNVVFHPDYEWMMASLDGITLDGQNICELKCPASYKPEIPDYYYAQMQHQLACSQAKKCYYFPYFQGDGEYVEVYPNKEYTDSLISKEKEFLACLINKTPPPLTDQDFAMRSDDIWALKSRSWIEASNQLKIAEEKEKEAREALIQCAGRSNAMGSGIKLSKSIRRGNIDYSAIPELKGVDVDNYRKESTEMFRISVI
jgi:putative phage-type endonuclease